MKGFRIFILAEIVVLVTITQTVDVNGEHILPHRENCNPLILNGCQKGDLIDSSIADCCYGGFFTCDAINDGWWDRTVDRDEDDECQPCGHGLFICGQRETNSRCVCDDTATLSLEFNECRCQYWPDNPSHHHVTPIPIHSATTNITTSAMPTMEPPRNSTTTEPLKNTSTTVEPPNNSTTVPPNNSTTIEPPNDNSTTIEPPNNSTTVPPNNSTTIEPPNDNSTTIKPPNNSTTAPPNNSTTIEPPNDNSTTIEPPNNSTTIPPHMTTTESKSETTTNLPADSTTELPTSHETTGPPKSNSQVVKIVVPIVVCFVVLIIVIAVVVVIIAVKKPFSKKYEPL